MKTLFLYEYYENVVLPQFGIRTSTSTISWTKSKRAEADEFVHFFSIGTNEFALIFEDYDGLGRTDLFVRTFVLEERKNFKFIYPTSATSNPPTYDGFHLTAPSQYCENVTGSFTLVQMI